MDAVDLARAFTTAHHPGAGVAVLGGSSVAGTSTATSDLDIALLYDDPSVNYAETVNFEGTFVETSSTPARRSRNGSPRSGSPAVPSCTTSGRTASCSWTTARRMPSSRMPAERSPLGRGRSIPKISTRCGMQSAPVSTISATDPTVAQKRTPSRPTSSSGRRSSCSACIARGTDMASGSSAGCCSSTTHSRVNSSHGRRTVPTPSHWSHSSSEYCQPPAATSRRLISGATAVLRRPGRCRARSARRRERR